MRSRRCPSRAGRRRGVVQRDIGREADGGDAQQGGGVLHAPQDSGDREDDEHRGHTQGADLQICDGGRSWPLRPDGGADGAGGGMWAAPVSGRGRGGGTARPCRPRQPALGAGADMAARRRGGRGVREEDDRPEAVSSAVEATREGGERGGAEVADDRRESARRKSGSTTRARKAGRRGAGSRGVSSVRGAVHLGEATYCGPGFGWSSPDGGRVLPGVPRCPFRSRHTSRTGLVPSLRRLPAQSNVQ